MRGVCVCARVCVWGRGGLRRSAFCSPGKRNTDLWGPEGEQSASKKAPSEPCLLEFTLSCGPFPYRIGLTSGTAIQEYCRDSHSWLPSQKRHLGFHFAFFLIAHSGRSQRLECKDLHCSSVGMFMWQGTEAFYMSHVQAHPPASRAFRWLQLHRPDYNLWGSQSQCHPADFDSQFLTLRNSLR